MSFNTSLNVLTEQSSLEIIYEFQVNDEFLLLTSSQLTQLKKMRVLHYKKTADVISFTAANAKFQYNVKHMFIMIDISNMMFLRLYYSYKLLSESNRKLLNQCIKSFQVLFRVENLAYHLNVSKK